MYKKEKVDKIKKRYGKYSTWALWDYGNEAETNIIENHIKLLHSNFIFIGLNVSQAIHINWGNFRGGKHDRKLKYAFNSANGIKGAYMTDLFKEVAVDAKELLEKIAKRKINISDHVEYFKEELNFVGVQDNSKFVVFGKEARKLYDEYFEKHFPNNKVYYLPHYSSHGKDKNWVEYVWDRLNINLNFEAERNKYK